MRKQVAGFISRLNRGAVLVLGCLILALQPTLASADFFNEVHIYWYDPNSAVSTCGAVPITGAGGSGDVSSTPTNFNLGAINNAPLRQKNLVTALMKDFGLSAPQAAGIVGNFMHESGGKNLPPNINEGGNAGPPRFKGGYGWAQWTGSRQRTFINYAVQHGFMASSSVHATDAANYAYLKHELSTGYTETIRQLRSLRPQMDESQASLAARAAVSFEKTFERAGVPALQPRMENAQAALEAYNDAPGAIPDSGAAAGCPDTGAAGGGVGISGNYAFPLAGGKKVVKNPGMFRNNTADKGGHPYTAYDILANPGTEVVAFLSGTVTHLGKDRCPGRLISVYNKESNLTISYLHLSFSNHVKEGDTIAVGQHIGVVGAAANGCGIPHLHIDAAQGNDRPGCSRLNCPSSNASKFVNIGPQLYTTFQKLP